MLKAMPDGLSSTHSTHTRKIPNFSDDEIVDAKHLELLLGDIINLPIDPEVLEGYRTIPGAFQERAPTANHVPVARIHRTYSAQGSFLLFENPFSREAPRVGWWCIFRPYTT